MVECMVTTSDRPTDAMIQKACDTSALLGCPFVSRDGLSLAQLRSDYMLDGILLVQKQGLVYDDGRRKRFFHVNLAGLRINNILNGKNDHMIRAMDLRPGQSVLDCTLGLASDAIVASYVAGAGGQVVGVESSEIIHVMTRDGLANMPMEDDAVRDAMRRICTLCADYRVVLESLKINQFDVVYFDPMFRHRIAKSSGIGHLREFANSAAVSCETIALAQRVAAKRVVLKERSFSTEFARLGFQQMVGGKCSSIAYGVIETGGSRS